MGEAFVDVRGSLHLSARVIPIPKSISLQAQAALSRERPTLHQPPSTDEQGWRKVIREMGDLWTLALRDYVASVDVRSDTQIIAGVTTYVSDPAAMPAGNVDKALMFLHGGGLVMLAGECTRLFGIIESEKFRCRVFAVDYRNPPDHPYPAALDDCVAVYRHLIAEYAPSKIVISGASGGGNLAAALTLKLRDLGLAAPGAVGLFTPEVDLTESGDTFETNRDIDVALPSRLTNMIQLYAGGQDLRHPYLSPIFGDFSLGYPPTFIQSGTRDLFLSNSVRLHRALRRAGIEAELHLGEGMPHGGFGGTPEDIDLNEEFVKFLAKTAGWAPL